MFVNVELGTYRGACIETAYQSSPPTNILDDSLDLPIRGTDPIAHGKWTIEVDHETTKKVREQVLRSKTHRNAADTAERQDAGDAVAQRLQDNESRGDQDRQS